MLGTHDQIGAVGLGGNEGNEGTRAAFASGRRHLRFLWQRRFFGGSGLGGKQDLLGFLLLFFVSSALTQEIEGELGELGLQGFDELLKLDESC